MDLMEISNKLELDKTNTLQHLMLLMNQGYVRKRNVEGTQNFYYVTEKGRTILKVIGPIVKEAHKIQMRNLEVIESVLSEAGY
jgi:predicted ArsR family transcriptional regulator